MPSNTKRTALLWARYDDAAKEWGALGARVLVPSAITYEPKINSMAVQGERTGAGARQENVTADNGTDIVGEAQGGRGRTVNRASRLLGSPGQVQVPAELRADVSAYGFYKWGTTAMFEIRIVNLVEPGSSYLVL